MGISQQLPIDNDAMAVWSQTKPQGWFQKFWGPRLVVGYDETNQEHLYYKNLSIFERLQACFGAGNASFKKIAAYCLEHHIISETLVEKIKEYNATHVTFKQVDARTCDKIEGLFAEDLVKAGFKEKQFTHAVLSGDLHQLFLWQKYSVQMDGKTPLEYICSATESESQEDERSLACNVIYQLPSEAFQKTETAFWYACFRGHEDIAEAFIDASIPLQLSTLNSVNKERGFKDISSNLIPKILKSQYEKARFEELQAKVPPLDALKLIFLEKLVNNDDPHALFSETFRNNLSETELSQPAVDLLAQSYPQSVQMTYSALVKNHPHLKARDLLLTALIMEYDAPKVENLFYDTLVARPIPKHPGWALIKERSNIYVITGSQLGEGTSKKAAVAFHRAIGQTPKFEVSLRLKDPKEVEDLRKEIAIWKHFEGSPHFVQLRMAKENSVDFQKMGIMVESCEGGDLDKFKEKQKPDLQTCLRLFHDVMHGMQEMHEKGITHGDMKLGNVFAKKDEQGNWRAKISDFGTSFEGEDASFQFKDFRCYGSPANTAPELFEKGKYSFCPTDIWACGVLLNDLIGREEFSWMESAIPPQKRNEKNDEAFIPQIKKGLSEQIERPLRELLDKENPSKEDIQMAHILTLLKGLMHPVPALRITAKEAVKLVEEALAAA